jgi:hypothetical protein
MLNRITNDSVNQKLDGLQNKMNTMISTALSIHDGEEIIAANIIKPTGFALPGPSEYILDYSKGILFSISIDDSIQGIIVKIINVPVNEKSKVYNLSIYSVQKYKNIIPERIMIIDTNNHTIYNDIPSYSTSSELANNVLRTICLSYTIMILKGSSSTHDICNVLCDVKSYTHSIAT